MSPKVGTRYRPRRSNQSDQRVRGATSETGYLTPGSISPHVSLSWTRYPAGRSQHYPASLHRMSPKVETRYRPSRSNQSDLARRTSPPTPLPPSRAVASHRPSAHRHFSCLLPEQSPRIGTVPRLLDTSRTVASRLSKTSKPLLRIRIRHLLPNASKGKSTTGGDTNISSPSRHYGRYHHC